MNQQREVIYNLRAFALEGGEELKGEAQKMLAAAIGRRVETAFLGKDPPEWDFDLLRQDLVMHYLLNVPAFEQGATHPASIDDARVAGLTEGHAAFDRKFTSLAEFGHRLLALVMLNVIDEKWKDHLYDLDQLRAAIHYRSWGQKDPLVEYKQEAYSMFEDLMQDVHHTFTERFLKVQLVFNQEPPRQAPPVKRFNALGVVEPAGEADGGGNGGDHAAPEAAPARGTAAEPTVVGAGRPRSLSAAAGAGMPAGTDLSKLGRNDPCPCGSGKKFKKCHGA
jgi:preprotein translocase subunit SecA